MLLSLALLIPAILASGLFVADSYRQQRSSIERQIRETARALSLVTDRQIGQQRVLVRTLALSPAVKAEDWVAFDALARAATAGGPTWIVVKDETGQQLVNTHAQPGARLVKNVFEASGGSWSVLPDGMRVSNLFTAPMIGKPAIAVDARVPRANGGEVNVAVVIPASTFDRLWRDQGLPDAWTGGILDDHTVIVSRSHRTDEVVGKLASPIMQANVRLRPSGVIEAATRDGVPSLISWSRTPEYPWTVIVAVPRSELASAARRSVALGVGMAAALLAIGVMMAIWVGEGIAGPVERLAKSARVWVEHDTVPAQSSHLAEVDALAQAFSDATRAVRLRETQLRDLNASLETRVAEATETLVQTQKLEAIGRLTGGVAHDFNNLLMAVRGNLELMARRITDERLLGYLDRARQACDRGAKLTGQLLSFSRRQRLEPRSTDVGALVAGAGALLSGALDGSVRINVQIAPDLWPAMADPTQLELVILNLAINARDAMVDGGVIQIATANFVVTQAAGSAEAPSPGDYVLVAVSDQGVGMSPEVRARVFEPFFTTKGVGQGSGLGLPQVLGLAKQLGGGVDIETAPGAGTTVRVYLPRANEAPPADGAVEKGVADVALRGLRVLVVDDDESVRSVSAAILRDLGCVVIEAAGGAEALSKVEAEARSFDVAVIDFAMPEMNGGETARRLALVAPDTRIVLMSGYAEADDLAKDWRGPVLHKPFGPNALASHISSALSASV